MTDGTCDGCIYAIPTVGDDKQPNTKCRRYPPQVFVMFGVEIGQTFPDAINRCGEYKETRVGFWEALKDNMKENDT